jgi:hypothetical protein
MEVKASTIRSAVIFQGEQEIKALSNILELARVRIHDAESQVYTLYERDIRIAVLCSLTIHEMVMVRKLLAEAFDLLKE